MSTRTSRTDVSVSVGLSILESIDTRYSRSMKEVISNGEWGVFSGFVGPYAPSYESAREFQKDYLASQLFSKYDSFPVPWDRKATALRKFRESEANCLSVNSKLSSGYLWRTLTPQVREVYETARRKIARCLGPFSWNEAEAHFRFGPGAAVGVKRRNADAYYKFGVKPSTTMGNLFLGYSAIMRVPSWCWMTYGHLASELNMRDEELALGSLSVVPGNKVVTVPKNAKSDRIIAVEPLLNVYIQMGVGTMIRHRLHRVGIDLRSQETNQVLALAGSLDGSMATIDLSSASDSISLNLIEAMLPDDWATALKQCRSPRGVLPDGTMVTYQKVSSMGNGYTFDLETLLFWAFASAAVDVLHIRDRRLAIYGDDIVIPADAAELCIEALSEFGFTTNADKTFVHGPFRESCGKHYFRGVDVTPFYIRSRISSDIAKFTLANNISRWSERYFGRDPLLKRDYDTVVSSLSRKGRSLRVPDGFGDVGLISDIADARPRRCKRMQCYKFRALLPVTQTLYADDFPMILRALYSMERRSEDGVTIAGGIPVKVKYEVGTLRTDAWRSPGPWL